MYLGVSKIPGKYLHDFISHLELILLVWDIRLDEIWSIAMLYVTFMYAYLECEWFTDHYLHPCRPIVNGTLRNEILRKFNQNIK